jgi:hypothetical protein
LARTETQEYTTSLAKGADTTPNAFSSERKTAALCFFAIPREPELTTRIPPDGSLRNVLSVIQKNSQIGILFIV